MRFRLLMCSRITALAQHPAAFERFPAGRSVQRQLEHDAVGRGSLVPTKRAAPQFGVGGADELAARAGECPAAWPPVCKVSS
jgi:hypothetical protein